MNKESVPISESVTNLNLFSVEFRAKIENLTKQVLLVSGGIQTITISAFLSGKAPVLTSEIVGLLKSGWLLLSISIICCLSLMLLQTIGMYQIGLKQVKKLSSLEPGVEVMAAWLPLRILNLIVGLAAFICCVVGVFIISKAAMALIGVSSIA